MSTEHDEDDDLELELELEEDEIQTIKTSFNTNNLAAKQIESAHIAQQIEEFLARGGKIQYVESNVLSVDYTNKAPPGAKRNGRYNNSKAPVRIRPE
jgi:hypothetical protein